MDQNTDQNMGLPFDQPKKRRNTTALKEESEPKKKPTQEKENGESMGHRKGTSMEGSAVDQEGYLKFGKLKYVRADEATKGKELKVKSVVRMRLRVYCCSCGENNAPGESCKTCGHDRCPECFIGGP